MGSPLIAWWWQGETPPVAALPAAALLLGGVALVVTDPRGDSLLSSPGRPRPLEGEDPEKQRMGVDGAMRPVAVGRNP